MPSRRRFLQISAAASLAPRLLAHAPANTQAITALRLPRYDQVTITGGIALTQQQNAQAVLSTFDDDALLKPFRSMGGMDAPGRDLGGWYQYLSDYIWHTGDAGFAPGHCFGQWTSAMARFAAAQNDANARNRVLRLHHGLATSITPNFFDLTRFPAYTLDKLNVGFLDAHFLLDSPEALAIADKVRQCALPSLPAAAMDRDTMASWRPDRDQSWHWDESYTLPENLFLLYEAGAGTLFRTMARTYLLDSFFTPLSRGQNVLGGLHGYSHVNALNSALQAWRTEENPDHLDAARNGYRMIEAQSFATGGWAPDETFEKPGSGKLLASLTSTHNTFETPCGTYAFLKLARSLLQLTRDANYGDAMERVLFNSFFAALPLQPDGRTFYYADLNQTARRVYSAHRWPCCAGTYPQVAADFGISTYLLDPEPTTTLLSFRPEPPPSALSSRPEPRSGGAERSAVSPASPPPPTRTPHNPGLWVNLYLPSTIRFQTGNTHIALTQTTDYPLTDRITLQLTLERPTRFPVHLRLPGWCNHPSLTINNTPTLLPDDVATSIQTHQRPPAGRTAAARWATLDRLWHNNDRLILHLPAEPRLESFPADGLPQPALAALCHGPLVLAAEQPTSISQAKLTTLQRISPIEWRLPASGTTFRPIFAFGETTYTTYLDLT